MAGDFNGDLVIPEGRECVEEIVVELASTGLEEMSYHFLPRCKYWSRDGQTLIMRRVNIVVRSRTDYLLGTDLRLYQNVSLQDTRHNYDRGKMILCG